MKDLISIIVPVYNTDSYLDRCFSAIAGQTYENFEALIIDDGSTDGSSSICDDWANKDSRFRVIHQKNAGQAAARNAGIDASKGDFIAFADSDDYIAADYLQKLYDALVANEADISMCGYYEYHKDETYKLGPDFVRTIDRVEALELLIKDDVFKSFPWGRLFRKELFDGVRFPVGRNYEDLAINYRLFDKASHVTTITDPLYNYEIREGSMSYNDASPETWHVKCHANVVSQIERTDYFRDRGEDDLAMRSLAESVPYLYSDIMTGYQTGCLDDVEESKKYLKAEKKNIRKCPYISGKDKTLYSIYTASKAVFRVFLSLKG